MSLSGNLVHANAGSQGYFWADLASNILAVFLVVFVVLFGEKTDTSSEQDVYGPGFDVISRSDFIHALYDYAVHPASDRYRVLDGQNELGSCDAYNGTPPQSVVFIVLDAQDFINHLAASCIQIKNPKVLFIPATLQERPGQWKKGMAHLLSAPGSLDDFTMAIIRLLETRADSFGADGGANSGPSGVVETIFAYIDILKRWYNFSANLIIGLFYIVWLYKRSMSYDQAELKHG